MADELDLVTGQDEIVNVLKTIPNVEVFEGDYIPEGTYVDADPDSKMFKPHLIVSFQGEYDVSSNEKGIIGPRFDPSRATFRVYCVAPFDRDARRLKDLMRNKIVGFTPTDGSHVMVTTGYSFTDADLGYFRYVHAVGFQYKANMNVH